MKTYKVVKSQNLLIFTLTVIILVFSVKTKSFGQEEEPAPISFFRGNISVTNNGLSLIPTFSLGRPAVIFELSLGGERLSFDPEIRFALNGQPWSFILWWRYKIIKSDKFTFHVGAHPALIFQEAMVQNSNGQMVESMEAKRFFAGEISPTYTVSEKFKVGGLYLLGRSLGKGPVEVNHFAALNLNFTNLTLFEKFFFNARPMAFYLKMNDGDGYFASSSFLLGRRGFPVSLGSVVSKKIVTNIEVDDWIWNISLVYSFNNEFVKRSNPLL